MVQSYLSWELVSSLIKYIDKCGKLEKVANTQKSNQKTKVSWCWNGEWKPTMSNAGWMHVNSCTEVRKPSIQLQDGKMCLHSWAFTVCLYISFGSGWVSLVAQMEKNPPAAQDTQDWSLGREDPPEKGIATPSCLKDSMGRGAWQATVHGVTESDMTECLTYIHISFKALHTLVLTCPSASDLTAFSPSPTPFTQVMRRSILAQYKEEFSNHKAVPK